MYAAVYTQCMTPTLLTPVLYSVCSILTHYTGMWCMSAVYVVVSSEWCIYIYGALMLVHLYHSNVFKDW